MQLLLILLPCTVVGTAIGLGLERAGLLPRFDQAGSSQVRPSHAMARPLSVTMIVMLASWILAWLVLLVIGINIILSSS